jgi:GNAT superfamily N-acetyltransferase
MHSVFDLSYRLGELQRWLTKAGSPVPPIDVDDGIYTVDPGTTSEWASQNRNRIEQFGSRGSATEAGLDQALDHYRSEGTPYAFIFAAPGVQETEIERWSTDRGFKTRVHLDVMVHRLEVIPEARCEFCIAEIHDPETLRKVAPDSHWNATTERLLNSPGIHVFGAFKNDEPVGMGNLYLHEGAAYLGGGFVKEAFRRQGGQSALLSARLIAAKAAGADVAFSETYGFLKSSLTNMERVGFQHAFDRKILTKAFAV